MVCYLIDGLYLECGWNWPGMGLEWAWNVPGICLEWTWNGPGINPKIGLKSHLFFTRTLLGFHPE